MNPIERQGERSYMPEPERAMQMSFVIPIAEEVENGAVFEQLRAFARMDADPQLFELVYVVNNSFYDAQEKRPRFIKNQRTFDVLSYVSGERNTVPEGILPRELEIVEACRNKKLRIRFMDKSSTGLRLTSGPDIIENARMHGLHAVARRFKRTEIRNGAVVTIDTDTFPERDMFSMVKRDLLDKPDVGTLRLHFDERVGEGGKELFTTTMQQRLFRNEEWCGNVFIHGRESGFFAAKVDQLQLVDPQSATTGWRDSFQPTSLRVLPARDAQVISLDRARDGDVGGQFGYARFQQLSEQSPEPKTVSPILACLLIQLSHRINERRVTGAAWKRIGDTVKNLYKDSTSAAERRFAAVFERSHTDTRMQDILLQCYRSYRDDERSCDIRAFPEMLRAFFTHALRAAPRELQALNDVIARMEKKERRIQSQRIGRVKRIIAYVCTLPADAELTPALLVRQNTRSPLYGELVRNPWIIETLQAAREKTMHEPDQASALFAAIADQFPELLKPLPETQYTKYIPIVRGMHAYMANVRAVQPMQEAERKKIHEHRTGYPVTAELIGA